MTTSRTALVIGANGNLGQAITKKLLSEHIEVIGADLHEQPSIALPYFQVDITNEESVLALAEAVRSNTAVLDIVINCSGILEDPIDSTDIEVSSFVQNISVNLIGAFIISKTFIPLLLKSSAGRLIHFSSMLGTEGGPRLAAYSASKAGITGLVKSLGKEYAKTPLTINAIAPSAVDTEMLRALGEDRMRQQVSLIPMGRAAKVEEVAHLVNYVASPETSFSTGYVFDISGGRSVY